MFLVIKGIGLDGHLVKRCSAKAVSEVAPGGVPAVVVDYLKDYAGWAIPDKDGAIWSSAVGLQKIDGASWAIVDMAPSRLAWQESVAVAGGRTYRIVPLGPRFLRSGRKVQAFSAEADGVVLTDQGGRDFFTSQARAKAACQTHLDLN